MKVDKCIRAKYSTVLVCMYCSCKLDIDIYFIPLRLLQSLWHCHSTRPKLVNQEQHELEMSQITTLPPVTVITIIVKTSNQDINM